MVADIIPSTDWINDPAIIHSLNLCKREFSGENPYRKRKSITGDALFFSFSTKNKKSDKTPFFLFVINELRLTIYYSPTHGAIYIVTIVMHIIFLILVNVSLPAPSAKHVSAVIQQYRARKFCVISIDTICYPRWNATRPMMYQHIF